MSLNNIKYEAMYVLGTVESNCNWSATYTSDPITLGIMQWYGTRAAQLLNAMKSDDNSDFLLLSSDLQTNVLNHPQDSSWWNSYYIDGIDVNSFINATQSDASHLVQENQWLADCDSYIDTLKQYLFTIDNPKQLIFAMSMYHQSPRSAIRVYHNVSDYPSMEEMLTAVLSDSVLGQYKNRYNTVYSLLTAWDGSSMPPDFGEVGKDVPDEQGGQATPKPSSTTSISRIEQVKNNIVVYGDVGLANGLICYPKGKNVWIPSQIINDNTTDSSGTYISSSLTYIKKVKNYLYLYGSDSLANGVICYPSGKNVWIPNLSQASTTITPTQPVSNPTDGEKVAEWYAAHAYAWAYSQGSGRLEPDVSGYTDCSASVWYAYETVLGIDIGTWTPPQVDDHGWEIANSSNHSTVSDIAQPGDLIFVSWYDYAPHFDHVTMYTGNNILYSHGGPGAGPHPENADEYVSMSKVYAWSVRRYV